MNQARYMSEAGCVNQRATANCRHLGHSRFSKCPPAASFSRRTISATRLVLLFCGIWDLPGGIYFHFLRGCCFGLKVCFGKSCPTENNFASTRVQDCISEHISHRFLGQKKFELGICKNLLFRDCDLSSLVIGIAYIL